MSSRHTTVTPQRGWLFGVILLIAMTAQIVVALSPLAEGRDRRLVSHVESAGAKGHYAHNDATCASCQARSIHGTTSRQSDPLWFAALMPAELAAAAERLVEPPLRPSDNPRAPPSMI